MTPSLPIGRWATAIAMGILLLAGRAGAQNLQDVVESRRDCATCHLEWATDFEKPGAVLLMDKPAISMASRESTCLGCHDSSVMDSRLKVWQEQSHKTGVKPPANMHIPAVLPLEDGKLACRTCHTAHNVPGTDAMSNTFFMRIENNQSQLCRACHDDKDQGPTHGSHPVGKMSFALPQKLVDAGAKQGPAGNELICQSCHAPHGSKAERLLVISASDSSLCISCHAKMRPAQWATDNHQGHPLNPPVDTVQKHVILSLGTHLGKENTLVCLSCHKMHDSPTQARLLADTNRDSTLCLRCHPDRQTVVNSKHDLRKSKPTTRNSEGQTPAESGPCGTCHTPHQYARDPLPAPGDPNGECMDCHANGRIAESAGAAHFDHPQNVPKNQLPANVALAVQTDQTHAGRVNITCITCHNPHDAGLKKFLRKDPDPLCGTCHGDKMASLAGQHDFTASPAAKNGQGKTAQETGKCGFCHSVHEGRGGVMWIATADAPQKAADMCLSCHRESGLAAKHPAPQFSHPTGARGPATRPASVPLPLFDAQGHRVDSNGLVQCASCHNPHADGTKSALLLRVTGNTSDLCLTCHVEKVSLQGSIHDSRDNAKWPGGKGAAGNDLCMACHRAHNNDAKQGLWAAAPVPDVPPADGVCLGCHKDRGWAGDDPQPGQIMHPEKLPRENHDAAGNPLAVPTVATSPMPLVAAVAGEERTLIGCKTCHDPHASRQTPSLLRVADARQPQSVCMTCHQETAGLADSMHTADLLKDVHPGDDAKAEKPLCGPCHAVHATDTSHKEKLWAMKLNESAVSGNEQRCLGCHDGTTAKHPNIPEHPPVAFNLIPKPATRPAAGRYLPTDRSFACNVCHYPHGMEPQDEPLPAAVTAPDQAGKISFRAATKPMLRPNIDSELCATCHGDDATRVLLYYHRPEQRQAARPLVNPAILNQTP